ncbi:hypothetical protein llap_10612 [Limosa lapponica baueri]|uniref:Uncharacterized protein n=1 Tax=Limosa lapponica baueri TaxID=1758121 RepID=A0A2I0TZ20_LIMLA|nr:hypothetical protein llap_10612 [Limosa lapponica baueri]
MSVFPEAEKGDNTGATLYRDVRHRLGRSEKMVKEIRNPNQKIALAGRISNVIFKQSGQQQLLNPLVDDVKKPPASIQQKLGLGDEGPKSWETQVAPLDIMLEFVKEAVKRTAIHKLPLKAKFCGRKKEPAKANLEMRHPWLAGTADIPLGTFPANASGIHTHTHTQKKKKKLKQKKKKKKKKG